MRAAEKVPGFSKKKEKLRRHQKEAAIIRTERKVIPPLVKWGEDHVTKDFCWGKREQGESSGRRDVLPGKKKKKRG